MSIIKTVLRVFFVGIISYVILSGIAYVLPINPSGGRSFWPPLSWQRTAAMMRRTTARAPAENSSLNAFNLIETVICLSD